MAWNPRDHDPEWPFEHQETAFAFDAATTALLVIDIQQGQITQDPDGNLARDYPQIIRFWNDQIETRVIPNTWRLQDYFRGRGMPVAFTRNGAVTSTAAETTQRLRPASLRGAGHRGTPAYEIDARIAPLADELVVDKLTSGAFSCTWLDHALRNMGVTGLVLTGVVSDMCVLGTARVAAELGYWTMICEDACAGLTYRSHTEAMLMHARKFGRVAQTQEIISELEKS